MFIKHWLHPKVCKMVGNITSACIDIFFIQMYFYVIYVWLYAQIHNFFMYTEEKDDEIYWCGA